MNQPQNLSVVVGGAKLLSFRVRPLSVPATGRATRAGMFSYEEIKKYLSDRPYPRREPPRRTGQTPN